MNRIVLLSIPLIAFLIPFLNFGIEKVDMGIQQVFLGELNEIPLSIKNQAIDSKGIPGIEAEGIIWMIYLTGFIFFLVRSLIQLVNIIRLKQTSQITRKGKIIYIQTNGNYAFSFFNWIFIPRLHQQDNPIIMEHEQIHARQNHSLDLMWFELMSLLFWYNPAFHLAKRNLRETHEFIADSLMIHTQPDPGAYLRTLLNHLESKTLAGFVNPFRNRTMKNRINRMISKKPAIYSWMNYMIFLPLIFILFMAFSPGPAKGSLPSIYPIKNAVISWDYGYEGIHPILKKKFMHEGIDYKAPLGTEIRATGDGRVIEVVEEKGWGKLIIIDHGDELHSYYAHLNDFLVKEGDAVTAGQVIGLVGNTGYSTGPHLHYAVRKEGDFVDPAIYFE